MSVCVNWDVDMEGMVDVCDIQHLSSCVYILETSSGVYIEQSCMFEADAMELWPTGILRRHTPKPLAVLITTGSFNPIHSGHIQCMEDARKAVEDKGYKVVAGYISPSSDGYVKGKMRRLATSANVPLEMVYADVSYRIHLTRLACADSGWLSCSSWEASQPGFVDFDDVTYALDMFLRNNSFFRSVRDTVFYVCGSDHYNKCGLSRGIYNRQDQKYRHVAVCVRLGDNDDADTITPPQSSVVTIVHSNSSLNEGVSASSIVTGGESDTLCDVNSTKVCATASLSSTKVRALLNSAPVGGQLPAEVDAELRASLPVHVYHDLIRGKGSHLYRSQKKESEG